MDFCHHELCVDVSHADTLLQLLSAGSLTARENRAPDHSSGPGDQSWLCPQLAMSFTHVLASVERSLPMAMMRWAGSSLEAESSFEILRSRVDLQHRAGHLLQVLLSQKWQLPARRAHNPGPVAIGQRVSKSQGGAPIALTLLLGCSKLSRPGDQDWRIWSTFIHLFLPSLIHSFIPSLSSKHITHD